MKIIKQFLKFSCMTLFCGIFLLACNSDEPEAVPELLLPEDSASC